MGSFFIPNIGYAQNAIYPKIVYNVTETVEYKLPASLDVTTLSPIVINRIRKRTTAKSVIEAIDENGVLMIKMRIHATENLDEPWMNPVKEIYIDDTGFYKTNQKNFEDYPWALERPAGNGSTYSAPRAHTDRSAAHHQQLKYKIQNQLVQLYFKSDMGNDYSQKGWNVENQTNGKFKATHPTKPQTTYVDPGNLVLIDKTTTDSGVKITSQQYTINPRGQKVPAIITESVPVTMYGICMQKITKKVYTGYETWHPSPKDGNTIGQLISTKGENETERSHEEKSKTQANSTPYLYPNPSNGKVMLSIPTDYDKPTITLFTMGGEQLSLDILHKSESLMQFSTQNMKAGIYLLQLKDSKHSETFKLFVY